MKTSALTDRRNKYITRIESNKDNLCDKNTLHNYNVTYTSAGEPVQRALLVEANATSVVSV